MSMLDDPCHLMHEIDSSSPLIRTFLFGAGILGNVAALVILEIRRRRKSKTDQNHRLPLFHIFITALLVTDLAWTCVVSPLMLLSHSQNTSLVGMSPESNSLCTYFGFSMTFFSLATMFLLFSMALERCAAIGFPLLHSSHATRKLAFITVPTVFLLSASFCLLPLCGFGKYVQYCPGTWCFLDMNPARREDRVYVVLYATVMLVVVLVIVASNLFVMYRLLLLYQRQRNLAGPKRERRGTAEVVEYLLLLVFMTIIFIICTMPLVVRVYLNSIGDRRESHRMDLISLRFISVNSIFDPWVFILLSPGVLRFFWASACRTSQGTSRVSNIKLDKQNMTPLSGQRDLRGDSGQRDLRGDSGQRDLRGDSGQRDLRGDSGQRDLRGDSGQRDLRGDSGQRDLRGDSGQRDLRGDSGQRDLRGDSGQQDLRGDSGQRDLRGDSSL